MSILFDHYSDDEEKPKKMKFGFDLHGVIDVNPKLFGVLISALWQDSNEIHIITGPPLTEELNNWLFRNGIIYSHFFSIVEHHEKLGTPMTFDDKGNAHLDPYLWDKTKGEYCLKHGIDLHFDDSDTYGYFFKTPYTRFYAKDGTRQDKLRL